MVETYGRPIPEVPTMEQFNNLIEFRQATYEHGFKAGDAQLELVDSILLGRPIRSFPELSLLPTFRRQWHSSYAAIERGSQDRPMAGTALHPTDSDPGSQAVFSGWYSLAPSSGVGSG
jgi:hypothetical protein